MLHGARDGRRPAAREPKTPQGERDRGNWAAREDE
jgi:hypothetical protein